MYTRRFITCAENDLQFTINEKILSDSVQRTPSLVDSFYHDEIEVGGEKIIFFCDPIYMVFNQERLNMLGRQGVEFFVQSLTSSKITNPLSELRKQCSDDDLLTMVKSRHLQQPSEILSWAKYMQSNVAQFQSEIAKLAAEKQAEQSTQQVAIQSNVEPKIE